ncbi:RAB6-interacting golgin (DUF662) [Quillaja saponaria]|uniref:RAB6-interacting golgin (DUF662) n=1 Tax=Quillaja saponaria TaxID=32244 RepID=A0AAD7Q4Y8_QUISA|nr:RAB6-interacting golgin (DUF662) [Quillaja saponaria]
MQKMKSLGNIGNSKRVSIEENEVEDMSKPAIYKLQSKEEEIEMRKMEVRERVELQLGRAKEATRCLAKIWEELEVLADPMKKEVAIVRKKIGVANRDLKSLGHSCQKKEKEYKEALEAFHEKNKEKAHLISTLMALQTKNEKMMMQKLEELNKILESIH